MSKGRQCLAVCSHFGPSVNLPLSKLPKGAASGDDSAVFPDGFVRAECPPLRVCSLSESTGGEETKSSPCWQRVTNRSLSVGCAGCGGATFRGYLIGMLDPGDDGVDFCRVSACPHVRGCGVVGAANFSSILSNAGRLGARRRCARVAGPISHWRQSFVLVRDSRTPAKRLSFGRRSV